MKKIYLLRQEYDDNTSIEPIEVAYEDKFEAIRDYKEKIIEVKEEFEKIKKENNIEITEESYNDKNCFEFVIYEEDNYSGCHCKITLHEINLIEDLKNLI